MYSIDKSIPFSLSLCLSLENYDLAPVILHTL